MPESAVNTSLSGRVIVVTGAGSGIGRATAEALSASGGHVIAGDISGAEECAAAIRSVGGMATGVKLDVSDRSSWERMVADILAQFGSIDALANVAGVAGREDNILTQTDEGWDLIMRVNLRGAWYGMSTVLPSMLEAGSGRIVNVSSNTGLVGMPQSFAYATSKAGLMGMTRQVAMEYADRGIRVNAVAPGIVETPMLGAAAEDSVNTMRSMTPVKRIGKASEVAGMIGYLISDAADYVTGQIFVIDGGWTVR